MSKKPRRRIDQTFCHTFEDCELTEDIWATVEVEAEANYEDHGIGPYEYWGSIGNDVDMQWTLQSVTVTKIHYIDDDNGEHVWNHGDEITEFWKPIHDAADDYVGSDEQRTTLEEKAA
jgi:hypothetical protein